MYTSQDKLCYTSVTNKTPNLSGLAQQRFTPHSCSSDGGRVTLQDGQLPFKKQLIATCQDHVAKRHHVTPKSYKSPRKCLKIL